MFLVLSSFVVIGGVGLIRTVLRVSASAERRGAMARQASELDIVREATPRPKSYPTIPSYDGLTNSPGIELAYRLPPSSTPGWRLLATTLFTLAWNGVACVLARGDGTPEQVGDLGRIGFRHVGSCAECVAQLLAFSVEYHGRRPS